jgi:polyphenol oxidase
MQVDWQASAGAWCSPREGGVSIGPFESLNLGTAVGDDPAAVAENRRRFAQRLEGARPVWLKQVHGVRVVRLDADDLERPPLEADAAWTDRPGIACTVQVADCLPVLFSTADGRAVAAAHAGWRGLAAGVLESTVAVLGQGAGAAPGEIHAWLGPCIGPKHFEVGPEVAEAFAADAQHLRFHPRPDGDARWLADLPALARARLRRAGLHPARISGGAWCTVAEPSRFFSYRRDRVTGRFAAAVWRRGG